MGKATILFLTLILCACEYRQPARFVSTTDTELYGLCLEASDRWYEATGLHIDCLYGSSDRHIAMSWGMPRRCAAGTTTIEEITIRHDPRPDCNERSLGEDPQATYLAIVTHELGHVLAGYRHGTHAESGVMARTAWAGDLIDRASIDWVCASADCAREEPE